MNRHSFLFAALAVAGCAGNGIEDEVSTLDETLASTDSEAETPLLTLSNGSLAGKIRTSLTCKTRPAPVSRDVAPLGSRRLGPLDPDKMGPITGFFPVEGAAPNPGFSADEPIEIKLAGPAYRTPAESLSLKLTFTNHTDRTVVLVRPLDGSLEQWRFPFYDLYARDESDGKVYRFAFFGARCGNVNPVSEADYVELTPKQSRDDVVSDWGGHLMNAKISKPGRYTVWVVYSFCGWNGRGIPLGQELKREDVYFAVHASNAHTVVVH
jgi:hypothetical protein